MSAAVHVGDGSPTITNGIIERWGVGVENPYPLPASPGPVTVRAVQFRDDDLGGIAQEGRKLVVEGSQFIGSRGYGIQAALETNDTVVTGSAFQATAVAIYPGQATTVADSRFEGNPNIVVYCFLGCGLAVRSSLFRDNGLVIGLSGHGRISLAGSEFADNDDVMRGAQDGDVEVSGSRVTDAAIYSNSGADLRGGHNVVTHNPGYGINAPGAVDLGGNEVHDNGR